MKINKNRKNNRRLLFPAVIVLVLIVVTTTYGVIAFNRVLWPLNSSKQNTDDNNSINYGPPTDQEVKDSQDGKKSIPDDNKESDGNNGDTRRVEVGIAFADIINKSVEVRAFTPSVVESDGICTATLTRGSAVVSAKSQAFIDSTTSQCQPIEINLSEFTQSGTWKLFVSYKSAKSQGKSEIIEVQIP